MLSDLLNLYHNAKLVPKSADRLVGDNPAGISHPDHQLSSALPQGKGSLPFTLLSLIYNKSFILFVLGL